jgi:pimeloyl-ACP methyl ester carboxylesterase
MSDILWHERGGSGPRTVLLLHGLGASGAVWSGVRNILATHPVQWVVPDLEGHGLSPQRAHYSVGQMAAAIAPLVMDTAELYIVGHSLGTYLGLALASRWFGVRVAGVLGIGYASSSWQIRSMPRSKSACSSSVSFSRVAL